MRPQGQTICFQVRVESREQASAGFNDTQIATALGCSVWTVRNRCFLDCFLSVSLRAMGNHLSSARSVGLEPSHTLDWSCLPPFPVLYPGVIRYRTVFHYYACTLPKAGSGSLGSPKARGRPGRDGSLG